MSDRAHRGFAPPSKRRLCWLLSLVLLSSSGCGFLRIARTPMERVSFRERGAHEARGAIVLFPGFGDRPAAFEDNGFVSTLAEHAPGYDVFGADAHFGYYRARSLLVRLEQDVIGPLRARGYREIWLVGASMGGHGAVAYARTHPQSIRGVLLFAPYMGPSEIVDEVERVGLCHYDVTPDSADNRANFARKNFLWLKRQACGDSVDARPRAREHRAVSLWLAVGAEDRLRRPDAVLGGALAPSHVRILPGGHGWKVWTPAAALLAETAFDTSGPMH